MYHGVPAHVLFAVVNFYLTSVDIPKSVILNIVCYLFVNIFAGLRSR